MTKPTKILPCEKELLSDNRKVCEGEPEMPEEELFNLMEQEFEEDEDLLAFLQECDNGKPLPVNKVVIPETLAALSGYEGPVYGFVREDSGYHVILGWEHEEPRSELKAQLAGFIGTVPEDACGVFLHGTWTEDGLVFRLFNTDSADEEGILLKTDIYTMKQDVFSRNSGLIETDWMDDQCAVICGCGSVGSGIALQLARSGVGRFILVDTDCVEIHNICRHQCSLSDVGRYKVDAVAERIAQINPQAQIKKFYQRIQDVSRTQYEEWITPEKAIFIGTCDNRLGDACACDLAYEFGVPFAALGFMTRAWAGEIYTCLPERNDICYRCAFKIQIENSIAEERRNHFYVGEEDLEKAHFEPGLDVDLEFGISLFDKVILDILNRNNQDYVPRIFHKMTQYVIFSGTDDRTYADPFWQKAFPTPIALRSLRHSDSCRRCEYCLPAQPQKADDILENKVTEKKEDVSESEVPEKADPVPDIEAITESK